ncbi:hypothetical protein THASP1DRAFT_13310, partial [Thamnocephalis sphaerospora]
GALQDVQFRKKWDLEEYKKRAVEREERDKELMVNDERRRQGLPPKRRRQDAGEEEEEAPRELLKQREGKLNLESRVGKTHLALATSGPRQPGFYCDACDCVLKDSISYLDHINGRRHQRNLGHEMNVERSTLEQVKARLAVLKAKKAQPKKAYG